MTLRPHDRYTVPVAHTWNGLPLPPVLQTQFRIQTGQSGIHVDWDAPFNDDPAPQATQGSTPRLWEHEVVELMLLGDNERYLELEFGPHGHYLVLQLQGVRGVKSQGAALNLNVSIDGPRWRGSVNVPAELIPPGWSKLNAFRIAGVGADRSYAAHRWSDAAVPDFHRLDCFVDLATVRAQATTVQTAAVQTPVLTKDLS